MRPVRTAKPRGQTWKTFLHTHAEQVWDCDFLSVTDLFFRSLFAFFIIELKSRRVIHIGVTRYPTDAWTAQQLREATAYGVGPKYLIRDNDGKFGVGFARVANTSGIEILKTPTHHEPMPSVNAFSGVCVESVLITCSSCMRSSFNWYSTRMSATSTKPGRIKASGSRYQSHKLGQCQQITQLARSSDSPSWVDYITTIAGALEFFHLYKKVGN
jgi:hypothetical protein